MRRWDGFVTRGDGATATERLQRQNRLDALAAQRPRVELGVQELQDRRDAAAAKAAELAEASGTARKALAQADEVRRSEEHTSELQSLMRISYADFCLTKTKNTINNTHYYILLE